VWERLFRELAARGRSDDIQMIDSTHVKAHRSASGGKGGSRNRRSAARAAGATRKSTQSQMLRAVFFPSC
jgi:transposase